MIVMGMEVLLSTALGRYLSCQCSFQAAPSQGLHPGCAGV
jgi:hypothetical protein